MITLPNDGRNIREVLSNLIDLRAQTNDKVVLSITYNDPLKPTLVLEFTSQSRELIRIFKNESVDISNLIPDDLPQETVQDFSVVTPEYFADWHDYIKAGNGLGRLIEKLVTIGNRFFAYKELNGLTE